MACTIASPAGSGKVNNQAPSESETNLPMATSITTVSEPSVAYLWTADDTENSRLDQQHHMLSDLAWHGKPYLAPVEDVLGQTGQGKAVLDLGTGSGIWAIDMALRFPKANVLGIDLAPKRRPMPPNCRLEVHDINNGLSRWTKEFDYVHTRLISSGIHDYPRLITEIAGVLRPGGLIELSEWDFRVYTASHQPRPVVKRSETGHSYIAEWLWLLRQTGVERGGYMDAAREMERWVRGNGDWGDVHCTDTWIPVSAPTGNTPEEKARNTALWESMKEDSRNFAAAARPALAQRFGDESVAELMEGMQREIEEGGESLFTRMTVVWARKTTF